MQFLNFLNRHCKTEFGHAYLYIKVLNEHYNSKFMKFDSAITKCSSTYCLENVKRYDYENFLSTLLLPTIPRDSAFAIRAFNIEIAQIKELTREELPARMRFQFWRDSLDQIYANKPPNHPVAKALYVANSRHKLSKKWLKNLIDSREETLLDRSFASLESLESYAEKSNSSVYYLILQCMDIQNLQVDHVASHVGKSEGITKFIRAIPYNGGRRRVLIPTPLLALHKVSQEDIIRGKREQKVKDVIYDIATVAYQHIDHAKDMEKEIPKESRIAFLPAINISHYLRNLQVCDFDVFDTKLQRKHTMLPFKLYYGKLKNSYR